MHINDSTAYAGDQPKFLFMWRWDTTKADLPSTTKHILLYISLHMDENGGECFPGVNLIAERCSLSKRAVIKHLAIAEREGWIQKRIRGYTHQGLPYHEYLPCIPEKVANDARHGVSNGIHVVSNDTTGERGASTGERGAPVRVNDVHPNTTYINSTYNSTTPSMAKRERVLARPASVLANAASGGMFDDLEDDKPTESYPCRRCGKPLEGRPTDDPYCWHCWNYVQLAAG